MNTHARPTHAVTLPADLPRRRWTLAEVERMVATGIVRDDERIELIDGEIVAMSPKGRRHEIIRSALAHRWSREAPEDIMVCQETPLQLDDHVAPEPDIILHPMAILPPDVRGDTVLLVVEIADSSHTYDLETKAPIYAAFGVREYWVIDARTLVTTLHRRPSAGGYEERATIAGSDEVSPAAVPSLGMSLAELVPSLL